MTHADSLFGEYAVPSEADSARLRDRLARSSDAAGDLDVAYRTMDTPVGELLLAATSAGLVRVAYLRSAGLDAELVELSGAISPRILRAPGRLEDAVRELDEYFVGRRTTFDLALDLRLTHGFRREVVSRLPHIGYGHTASYAEIAAAAGSPRAVRAVGTACALNPLPIVVPCHRVVRSDGSLGRYAGGAEAKAALLALEQAA